MAARKNSLSTRLETWIHSADKRKNVPAAEFRSYPREDEAAPREMLYEKRRRTLKAEIDEAAWATLRSASSRPFPEPKSGRIAVKVINHYGDEVLKVYEIGGRPCAASR